MAITWANNGGFSDIQPGIVPLDELSQMLTLAAPLYPRYWRIMAAWNYIALEPDPGDPVASPPSYGTGTTAYAPPTTTNRDWSSIDRCINEIMRTTGAEIILMIGQNRPKYGSHHGGGASGFFGLFSGAASLVSGGLFGALTSSSSKVTADDYGSFAAEVATRYKVGGVGIAPDLAARGKGVRIFEAWNEENSKYTWVKNVDTKMYFEYLQAFYNSVKAVPGLSGSASEVMFGSLTHVPDGAFWYGQGWITDQESDFMSKLYALGAQPYFDSVGIHPYTTQDAKKTGYSPDLADDAWLQAVSIHNSMVTNGDGSKPVHITELGYATSMCTEQQQSDYHEATLALINANFPWVSSYLVYCFKDSGTNKKALNQTLGCFWHDLSPKILYTTLLSMSVQAAAFNLGVAVSLGDTGAPGPGHGTVNLGVTTGIGMTGVGRSPASMNVGVTLGIGMTAVEHDGGQFNLGVTLGITETPAGLTPASMNIGVTTGIAMSAVEHDAGAFNIGVTCGIGMTGADKEAGSFSIGVTTGIGMSGALPAAGSMNVGVTCGIGMSAKMSYDFTFSGSTKPTGIVDAGSDLLASTVSSGTLQEGNTSGTVNGTWYGATLWMDPTITVLQDVTVTVGALSNVHTSGDGPAVGFDSAGTNGVFAVCPTQSGGAGSQIMTKVGNTYTQRAQVTTLAATGDLLRMLVTVSAGIYTYTLYKNGTQLLTWTDSTAVITPGLYWGTGWMHLRSSGVQIPSRGVTRFQGKDS